MCERPPSSPRNAAQNHIRDSGWDIVNWSYFKEPDTLFAGLILTAALLAACMASTVFIILLVRTTYAAIYSQPDDVNKLLLSLAGLLGAPFLVWRVLIASQQTAIARETHYTTLFTSAIGQLGATREIKEYRNTASENGESRTELITSTVPNIEARVGAIYALERIAQDSIRDHWPIMETLCAYVRANAGPAKPISEEIRNILQRGWSGARSPDDVGIINPARWMKIRADIEAALNVLGRRTDERRKYEASLREKSGIPGLYCLDLTDSNLQCAVLSGLNFDYADFGESNLAFAQFKDTHLEKAGFASAYLEGANFSGAAARRAHFDGTRLDGIRAEKTDFTGALFIVSSLRGSNLRWANLANIEYFVGSDVEKADLYEANLSGSNLSRVSGLTREQIEMAVGDGESQLPPDIARPQRWGRSDRTEAS